MPHVRNQDQLETVAEKLATLTHEELFVLLLSLARRLRTTKLHLLALEIHNMANPTEARALGDLADSLLGKG